MVVQLLNERLKIIYQQNRQHHNFQRKLLVILQHLQFKIFFQLYIFQVKTVITGNLTSQNDQIASFSNKSNGQSKN
jgi:hypothetical protein